MKITEWHQALPDQCPPPEAICPSGGRFYRLVISDPPTNDDYLPTTGWKRPSPEATPCIQKSVSIFTDLNAIQRIAKFGTNKQKKLVSLLLPPGSGLIKQTFKDVSHYSWWRAASFDPVANSRTLT